MSRLFLAALIEALLTALIVYAVGRWFFHQPGGSADIALVAGLAVFAIAIARGLWTRRHARRA